MLPGNQSVGEVLKWSPEAVVAWVQQHRAAIDCSQDWQDLAYGCSSTATCNSVLSDDELVVWATAAALVYDRLGETCTKASDRSHSVASGMSLRAFVINKLGHSLATRSKTRRSWRTGSSGGWTYHTRKPSQSPRTR